MSANTRQGNHRPFKNLDRILKQHHVQVSSPKAVVQDQSNDRPLSPRQEARLFAKAMSEVKPITSNRVCGNSPRISTRRDDQCDDDQMVREALMRLVKTGRGYRVSDTSEYMEAAAPGIGKELLRRLHQGRYAIQSHIDLHGMRCEEAQQALATFMREAIGKSHRAVVIVHGRGLSSPKAPVLKKMVYAYLTRGWLRKWVIALVSARPCDGGAGATYVLLRQRPATKSQRKNAGSKSQD